MLVVLHYLNKNNMCNNYQNTTCYQCNQPPICAPNDCSCPVKDLSTDCVLYTGNDLPCSGIKSQTILTELIQQLDEFICTLFKQSSFSTTLINIGNGANVYKGLDLQGRKEIRRINAVGDLVTVTQNTNDISVSIDEEELSNFIQNELPPPICLTSLNGSVWIKQLKDMCYDFSVVFRGIENIGGGAGFYKTFNPITNNYQFKSLIVDSQNGSGASVLRDVQQNTDDVTVRLKKITSNTLDITVTDKTISLDIPSVFQGIDYYVNNNYTGAEELGTASKPFRDLKRCIDVILNRAYQDSNFVWVNSPNPSINGGNAYKKWDLRPGIHEGAVRVIIQSYTETNENIAINRVEYFLERGGFESMINVPSTGTGANLEYILDMKELVDNVPKISGQLPYELRCAITGKGALGFYGTHTQRKGFVRAYGHNDGSPSLEQPDSNLFFGSVGGYINCLMYKKPTLTYTPLYSDAGNTIPIIREGVHMTGYQTSSVPDYGAIQVEGANAMFRDSLFLNGVLEINCYEQHLFYAKNFGTAYGDNGRIYIRRNAQHINYSTIEYIDINPYTPDIKKFYKPSTHIYDFYLKNGAILSYAGDIYSQENTGYIQGGSEAFVCLENTTTDGGKMCSFNANGGGRVVNLFYNHYIKSILNPAFLDYQHHGIALKNLKITSQLFEEVISVVDTSDNDWTKIVTIGNFVDTVFQDYLVYGLIRLPFSNLTVNDKLFINGTTIGLYKGMLNSNLPIYPNNAAALADGYPVGGFYKDTAGNLKVVI